MRTSIKYVLVFFALVALIGIGLTLFSGDSEARTCVWDGESTSALASNATNWDTNVAPIAGDNILFDGLNATGDDACTWDISLELGTFTIGAGYSGTITQSSDMHITRYSQSGGTFTGVTTKWVYCSGNFTQSAGTVTNNVLNLNLTDCNISISANLNIKGLIINGEVNFLSPKYLLIYSGTFIVNYNSILNIASIAGYINIYDSTISSARNYGIISGPGLLKIDAYRTDRTFYINNINCPFDISLSNGALSNRVITINNNLIVDNIVKIFSQDPTYTCTLNLNGHSLTASTITVGTRGILDCRNGTITCSALTSTSGTITEDTATWVFNDGAVVTATSGEKFYNVHMKGDCDFVNSVNVTNDLRFVNVPVDYDDLDVYLDTVYSVTIPSPYTFGPEITAAAEYTYLPDVQIEMSQFYEDVDFSIYAYINTNLPVTYNITGTASSWLSYHEGRIVGMPPEIGNYTYTITATHASGSIDVVNGYILVGSLSTAEYSYDQIWGLILWIVITAFMLIGLLLNIPLIQIVAFMGTIGSIVASLRIPEFEVFLMMFALGNSALFFIGMVRYRR